MTLSEEDFSRLKENPSFIIEKRIECIRTGPGKFKAICPFHQNDKDPSLRIDDNRRKWKCFGCDAQGDAIDFVKHFEDITNWEAIKIVAKEQGVEIKMDSKPSKYDKHYKVLELAKEHFSSFINDKYAQIYLKKRDIQQKSVDHFHIGYAPHESQGGHFLFASKLFQLEDGEQLLKIAEELGLVFINRNGKYNDMFRGRIMWPIYNNRKKLVGFSGRRISDKDENVPKYLNSKDSVLFKKHELLLSDRTGKINFVVEGNVDVTRSWQNGVSNIGATLSSELNDCHAEFIKRNSDSCTLIGDCDRAGKKFVYKGTCVLVKHKVIPYIGFFKDDPGVASKEDWSRLKTRHGLSWIAAMSKKDTPEDRVNAIRNFTELLGCIDDQNMLIEYIRTICLELHVHPKQILHSLGKIDTIPMKEVVDYWIRGFKDE